MGDDARGGAIGDGRNVECEALPAIEDAEELARRSVAEDCAWTTGEDSGQPDSLLREVPVSDREDPAMDRVKVVTNHQGPDPLRTQAGFDELRTGCDAVLAGGESGDGGKRSGLMLHTNPNPDQRVVDPLRARSAAPSYSAAGS